MTDWPRYLARFHEERAGITEQVLGRAQDAAGDSPYDWLRSAVGEPPRVLDLACGSAPLAAVLGPGYLGVDVSAAELALARSAHPDRTFVRATASALPLAGGRIDVVVCSMALMLMEPLPPALAEVRRVLRPGGRLAAIVPAQWPLSAVDLLHYSWLMLALRRRGLGYPHGLEAVDRELLAQGLRLDEDEARRFAWPLRDAADAETFVRSLYLPGADAATIARGTASLSGRRIDIGIPIRRLLATAV